MTEILVVFVCLLLNAIFSSIEMAFVTVGKPALRQRAKQGDLKAQRLLTLRESPERALSVIQLGITLVGAISAAVGGAGAEESLAPFFEQRFGFSEDLAEGIAIGLVVIPITYFSVVLGELVPKTIALRYPTQILKFGTNVLYLGSRFLGPIVTIFEFSTRVFVRLALRKTPLPPSDSSSAELDLMTLSPHQRQYILNLANIEMKKVKDAFLPWEQVYSISSDARLEDVVAKVVHCGHTRIPVINDKKLDGILHSKEFLAFAASGNRDWTSILRPAVEARSNDDLLGVLHKLQTQKRHMAVVVENHQLLGLITLEDIIEEVIGEIYDEDDDGLVRRMLANRAAARKTYSAR